MGQPVGNGVRDFVDSNFYWPKSIDDVCRCVKEAANATPPGKVRVRGSQHSEESAVYTTGFNPIKGPPPTCHEVNLILDHLRGFYVTDDVIAVETGHHLGPDPYAHGPAKDPANSLVYKLNELDYALPELGGISHQSLAGFLSTGSAGGSVRYELTEAIAWIKLVDGRGELKKICRTDHDFDAVLPSLGLFGIIVEVGFSRAVLPERYDVGMSSISIPLEKWSLDPFKKGELAHFFREHEYARLLWWPQPMVDKVEVWTGTRESYDPARKRKPYKSFTRRVQRLAHWIYWAFLAAPGWLRWFRRGKPRLAERLVALILNVFLQNDEQRDLYDDWNLALPTDNQIDDDYIPVIFTEMWIDLDRAHEVMQILSALFKRRRLQATGTMCFEIYAAKKRSAWLSPSHGTDVLRVDPFIFWRGKTAHKYAHDFFELYWEELRTFGFRCHWGKTLSPAKGPTGASYRRATFPKLNDFLALRKDFDPYDVFLTDYWRNHLGI